MTARRRAGSVALGLERTVVALGAALGPADEALVAAARGLAAAVDADPGNGALWREYRAALTDLRMVGAGGVDDDTGEFLVSVRTPRRSSLGNASKP